MINEIKKAIKNNDNAFKYIEEGEPQAIANFSLALSDILFTIHDADELETLAVYFKAQADKRLAEKGIKK